VQEKSEYKGSGYRLVELESLPAFVRPIYRYLFGHAHNALLITSDAVTVPRYFYDLWNYADLSTYALVLFSMLIRVLNFVLFFGIPDIFERQIVSLICLLFWIKVLPFVGIYKTAGPLLRMISKMIGDFAQFLIVYSMILVGFSLAFYVLLGSPTGNMPNFLFSILCLFRATTGDFGFLDEGDSIAPLAYCLFVCYVLVATIMMLNLLIAMMNNSFNLVQYSSEKEWLMIRALLIMRIQRSLGRKEAVQKMKEALVDLCKATAREQNFTPGARVFQTQRYFVWEPAQVKEDEAEVSLQLLRNEIRDLIDRSNHKLEQAIQKLERRD